MTDEEGSDPGDRGRRTVLAGLATTSGVVVGGCTGLLGGGSDTDDDGVPDGEDAAPLDDRVQDRAGGDPAPGMEFDFDPSNRSVRITYTGGDVLDTDDTDRLEVTAAGETVGTLPLPFRVGDTATVRGLPGEGTVRVVWFGPDGGAAVVDSAPIPASKR